MWRLGMHAWLFSMQPMCHTWLFVLQPTCTLNTRLTLKQWLFHMCISYIHTRVYLNSMLKKYKSRLVDISWALIHDYLNCLNHPNLRNHSISSCINRGLGMGLINHSKKREVMLVVFLQTSWSSRTYCPWFAQESLFQMLGCNLISFVYQ